MNFEGSISISKSCLFFVAIVGTFGYASGQMSNGNLNKLATANNIFGLNLHRIISAGSDENVFFSPLSLSTVLGMIYYGARGESAKELRQALGYEDAGLPDEAIHSTFHQLLNQISNSSNNGYILKSASAILVDEHLSLRPEYKTSIQDVYLSPVREVNFARDGQRIVGDVNRWVEAKTGGKIRQVLKEVHPMTAMVLLNAVYFKGKWKIPFHPRLTRREVFYNGGLRSKKVPMMRHSSPTLLYAVADDYQAVELPYVGETLSMLIILPKLRDGLPALENNLTSTKLDEIRQRMFPEKLDLRIPKFQMEFSKNLSPELQRLGVHGIFKGGSEDFSGISMRDSSKMYVTDVIHKSKIRVNEEGTEATAFTMGLIRFVSVQQQKKVVFRADHPFVFFILEKRTGLILFMGRVLKL